MTLRLVLAQVPINKMDMLLHPVTVQQCNARSLRNIALYKVDQCGEIDCNLSYEWSLGIGSNQAKVNLHLSHAGTSFMPGKLNSRSMPGGLEVVESDVQSSRRDR